jgi:two-component system LytT family sensor kinase
MYWYNSLVTHTLCALFLAETIALYYLMGRWFFPRYVYTRKLLVILFSLPLCFLLIYWINFLVFSLLVSFSNGVTVEGNKVWIVAIWDILSKAGWMGCFTDGVAAYWNFAFSFEVVLIYLAFKIFNDILLFRENKQKLEKENIALELDFLKSQINPHFLFNTLNSIYSRTVDVNEEASELVLKLAELMRYSLYRTGDERVLLSDELRYIQSYIDLEKYRYSEKPDISFDTDGMTPEYKIPPLLLIPLVENAFKHGIGKNNDEASFVKISALIEDSVLYFSVENSLSRGIKKNVLPNRDGRDGGLGIATLKRRLNLLYPASHHFTTEASDDRYEVMLQIPLETGVSTNLFR